MKPSYRPALLAASLLAMPSAWAQSDLEEGLWEVSVTMAIGGQPTSAQPLVVRECIAQQNAQELMSQLTGAGTCNTADLRQEGNRATWRLTCSSPVEMEGVAHRRFVAGSTQ